MAKEINSNQNRCFLFISLFWFFLVSGSEVCFAVHLVRSKEGHLTYQCGYCGFLPESSMGLKYAKNLISRHTIGRGCIELQKIKSDKSLTVHKVEYGERGTLITLSLNDD